MQRVTRLILAVVVLSLALPAVARAQQGKRPSNNMWTRSAALYLDRARTNTRPEDRRALYQQALDATLEGIQNDPENPRVWFLAGRAYIFLNDYVRADSMLDKAESLYPDYVEESTPVRNNAWINAYNAGVTALQQGNLEDALAHLERADVIYQGRPGARLNLGSIYVQMNEPDKAIEAFRGALEILRGPARETLSRRETPQWTENEEVAAFNLAQLLANVGRDEEAAQAYRDFLARDPSNTTAKINLAVVLSRQEKDEEASELYSELLQSTDLGDRELFMIGVGLFRSEEHERAREAFKKALDVNPYFRDALYNLSQSIYVRATRLEEEREAATGAEEARLIAELGTVYDELREIAEQVRSFDPNNRNVQLLTARAYRGLADVTAEEAASDQWRGRALALLEEQQNLPFEVGDVVHDAVDGQVTVRGRVVNLNLDAGAPVKLRVALLGAGGAEAASQEVTVSVGEKEVPVPFVVSFEVAGEVLGWKYEAVP